MPDPARTRRAPTPSKAERADTAENKLTGPLWARAVHHFYDAGFDVRSSKGFQSAIDDFVSLDPAERAFHETHLLYRLVLGVEGVYGVLQRIEKSLANVSSPNLAALEHLAPIRAALEEIASSQPDLVRVDGLDGDEEDDEDEDEEEDELGDEDEGGEDPDFIYDTVPDEEPEQPRRPRRQPQPEATRAQPQAHRADPQREPARPPRAADPEREALVGELVPASEGPHGEAGER